MIDSVDLMTKAERLRRQLGEDNNSPVDIFALAQLLDELTLVFRPMGNNLSGMCIKDHYGNCTIAINSLMTVGRQRFSLAHQFYHMFYDENMVSVCSKQIDSGRELERKADMFASFFLIPRAALLDKVEQLTKKNEGRLSLTDIIWIEQFFGVSHQATLFQLLNCRCIGKNEVEEYINVNVSRRAAAMGFNPDLYKPTEESKRYFTYGRYLNLVDQLNENDLVSNGRYEELLLDAFRADLVYGSEERDIID